MLIYLTANQSSKIDAEFKKAELKCRRGHDPGAIFGQLMSGYDGSPKYIIAHYISHKAAKKIQKILVRELQMND
jgi:hypothetical protein